MAIFNWFGKTEHKVFNYKPRYYDEEAEARKKRFGDVDGSKEKEPYVPGSYIKGSMRDGNYSKEKSHEGKTQNLLGLLALILVVVILIYIAKFYALL